MRLYRALLRLYPASFRAEYGEEICGLFGHRRRRASGPLEVLVLWLEAVRDLVGNAARVHWDLLRQDLVYAARTLRRSPAFALTAVVVTALGIGANTAVFTVTDRALVRPLPFADAESLVQVWGSAPGYRFMELSPANFRDLRRSSRSFERLAAYYETSVNLVGVGEPQRIDGVGASADLFALLGARALHGRVLDAEDERPEAADTVVLSHGLWQRAFAADPRVIGASVRLDDVPVSVVGVMPPEFEFPSRQASFWRPLRFAADDFEERDNNYLRAVGRLAAGVSLSEASSEVAAIADRLAVEYPQANRGMSAHAVSLRDELARGSRLLLLTLFAASTGVLLVACTNLASLLWVRALSRRKELALRSTLGAGRERMVRQLLTESLVLAGCGGLLGVGLAALLVPLVSTLAPAGLPGGGGPPVDLRMLVFAALLSLGTGVGFGVIPALRIQRGRPAEGLAEGARTGVGGRRQRARSALVVTQVAVSVVLLAGSVLLLRALWRVQSVDPGFEAENVLTLETAIPMSRYAETARRALLYDRVLAQVRALPEVVDAAYISFLPLVMRGGIWPVEAAGPDDDVPDVASLRFVTPGFFSTLGIPVLAGRDVAESDVEGRAMAAVVSRSFAERYWPGRDPLGQTFDFAFRQRVVVGLVGDVRFRGLERASEPQVYLPYRQVPDGAIIFYAPKQLVVRSSTAPLSLLPAIRAAVRDVDPELPVSRVRLLADIVAAETSSRRTQLAVLAAFTALALGLAGLGLHGLLSFSVGRRLGELGVRRALGASNGAILGTVLGHAARLTAVGCGIGLLLAYVAGRSLEALLAGGPAGDPIAFAVAVLVVMTAALSGSVLPAIQAVGVAPTAALRAG